MKAIYQLRADELDQSFLDALKAAFKDKQIEIAVYERDETAYLLRSPANRDRLLRAIADVEKPQSIVAPDYEKFQ
jgi:antitoxin YefM